MTPIYQSSTYRQDAIGRHKGYEYSRTSNPTRRALEDCIAALEGGARGLAFASGMAATDAVLHLLGRGDHVVALNDLYGGTYRLFQGVYAKYGVAFEYGPAAEVEDLIGRVRPGATRMVWLETPTNPWLSLCDLEFVCREIHRAAPGALICVDNTFATPYLQQPLALGADLVVHSATKYLGGHSDVVGGLIVTRDPELGEQLAFLQNAAGAVPGPMDCFLILRGLKTLAVRMDRHALNAGKIAQFLETQPEVARVLYPGSPSHPQHDLAVRQMRNGGGMVSFLAKNGPDRARRIAESTEIFALAESLGGVESLIEVPAAMTHLSAADSPLAVDPALIRLSVGLEAAEDLVEDLKRALGA
jgi:cystathionine beta-lyase/cystathionine gamma-synthase